MCDVDDEAVVAAVDAPSIYDIPKVLHAEGLDAYVVRRLGPAVPRRRLDGVGRPAAPGAPARRTRSPSRWSASTSTCPTPTCRSPRRCAPAASPTTARVKIRWVTSDDCADPGGRRARSSTDVDAVCIPGGFGVRGIEGKLGAVRLRPRAPASRRSASASACSAWSSSPPATWPASTDANSPEFDEDTAAPGHRHHGRPAATSSPASATWAAPCGSGSTRPTLRRGLARRARSTARPYVEERHRHRYEVNNAYREQLEEAGLVFSGHLAGRPARRVRRAAARRAPVLRRHPGAPGVPVPPDPRRTRCSPAWSRPRSPARRAVDGRRSTDRGDAAGTARRRTRRLTVADEPADAARSSVQRDGAPRHGLGRPPRRRSSSATGRRSTREVIVPHRARSASSRSTTHDRVLLLRQYRHPVRSLPVGAAGRAARRRRARTRCDARAARAGRGGRPAPPTSGTCWSTSTTRPGGSTEAFRCYLARGLHDGAGRRAARARATRSATWRRPGSPLDEARDLVLAGRLHNPTPVCGILAAAARPRRRLGHAAAGRRAVAGALARPRPAGPQAELAARAASAVARSPATWTTSVRRQRTAAGQRRRRAGRRVAGDRRQPARRSAADGSRRADQRMTGDQDAGVRHHGPESARAGRRWHECLRRASPTTGVVESPRCTTVVADGRRRPGGAGDRLDHRRADRTRIRRQVAERARRRTADDVWAAPAT